MCSLYAIRESVCRYARECVDTRESVSIRERVCTAMLAMLAPSFSAAMFAPSFSFVPSPALSPTDPVPRGLLTLWARAAGHWVSRR